MKKMVLTGLKEFEFQDSERAEMPDGYTCLKVLYCAICKTDAKMWHQGHRDLVFPRVLGHEVVAVDEGGQRFALWPGTACGSCGYCNDGRENLCENMKILGFHNDGGFAETVIVPNSSLMPLPAAIPDHIGCFTEPVGCVFNALGKLELEHGQRVIVYGGGTVGLITALVCRDMGTVPLVIEKSEKKIASIDKFLETTGIPCVKDTVDSEFDAVINACPDFIAFNLGIAKVAKGGRISFFSGITKNEHVETNLLNLLHYKEVTLTGAYGLTKKNMEDALPFMARNCSFLEKLVEDIVPLKLVPELIQNVLSGSSLKYIVDVRAGMEGALPGQTFSSDIDSSINDLTPDHEMQSHSVKGKRKKEGFSPGEFSDEKWCRKIISAISPVDGVLRAGAQSKLDNKTKPLGALGTLEYLALQMSLIQQTLSPTIRRKSLFVFAADHGITEEGVSAYPSEVTKQMVMNFLDGGAAINVLCRHHSIDIKIIDMGVNGDFEDHPDLIQKKVRKGTRNFAIEAAMTRDEVFTAIKHGMNVFMDSHSHNPIDIVGLGEMGIGNTTSASAIISVITGISPEDATGRGTGVDNQGLSHKMKIIKKALDFHKPDPKNGFEILEKIGGYEIAGITGAVLAATSKGVAVVLDGVISTAGGLLAFLINPDIIGYLVSGHRSVEKAQQAALEYMGLESVIDFKMRLGEGTGAALTMDTADAACKIMCEMASFENAGVSKEKRSILKRINL